LQDEDIFDKPFDFQNRLLILVFVSPDFERVGNGYIQHWQRLDAGLRLAGRYHVTAQGTANITGTEPRLGAGFTERRKDFGKLSPTSPPLRDKLLHTIIDVSVMIKCQQTGKGSLSPSYNYHLGNERDRCGISQKLLQLGYTDGADRSLVFIMTSGKGKAGYTMSRRSGTRLFMFRKTTMGRLRVPDHPCFDYSQPVARRLY